MSTVVSFLALKNIITLMAKGKIIVNNTGLFNNKKWIVLVLIFISAGCSMNRLPNIKAINQASLVQSRQSSQSPQEAVSLAEKDIETAHQEALEYFAPIHLSLAEESLKKAQSLLLKGADPIAVIAETIKSRKMTADGLLSKQSAIRQLRDVFEMKERLQELKAEVYFRDEYEDRLDDIKKLIRYIEKGDQETLDDKKKDCFGEMLALEIDVVKKITLSEPIQIFNMAKKIDAKKLAPKTWKTAKDTLEQSQVCIESFPRDKARVAKAGLDALRACQHVYFVTKEVLTIQDIDKDEFENLVLEIENKLNRISLGLNHGDVRYMSLYDQSVALSSSAEALNSTLSQHRQKETHSNSQEEIVAESNGISTDKGIPEEVPEEIVDNGLNVEKSSENVQVAGSVSEPREPETDLPEMIAIGSEKDSPETDAPPSEEQEPEVAESLPDESISEKQAPQVMVVDDSTASEAEVLEDDSQVSEIEKDAKATTVENGQLPENDPAAEVREPETKPLEVVNEIVPDVSEDIIPSAKQSSEVSDTPNPVGS